MSEVYRGTKFEAEIETADFHFPFEEKIFEIGKIFVEKKLAPQMKDENGKIIGTCGNLSHRVAGDTFLITRSGADLGALSPQDMVWVLEYLKGRVKAKSRVQGIKPSSETPFHSKVYSCRSDVNCILHGHLIPEILSSAENSDIVQVPEFEYGSEELADGVCMLASRWENTLILKKHGFICFGKDADEALKRSKELLERLTEE